MGWILEHYEKLQEIGRREEAEARADRAEQERDELKAEVERLRVEAEAFARLLGWEGDDADHGG